MEHRLQEKQQQYDALIALTKQQLDERKAKRKSQEEPNSRYATSGATTSRGTGTEACDILPLGEGVQIIDEVKVGYRTRYFCRCIMKYYVIHLGWNEATVE